MRVSAITRARTRRRILQVSAKLFDGSGFEACTTRQIADAAGIAAGTLFNYFDSKEAVLAALVFHAVEGAPEGEFKQEPSHRPAKLSFEEELFALIMSGLRRIRSFRRHLPALLQTALSPLAVTKPEDGESFRATHLDSVARLAKRHGLGELSPVAMQLYWTLYTGALVFWAADRSPKQQDTLALLDESLSMFMGWLQADHEAGEKPDTGVDPCHRP